MNAAVEILSELAQRGANIRADGETICLKPKSALDDKLLARVREHKQELLAALRKRPVTCSASCYEVEPGRWLHHPWDDCRTARPLPPPRQIKSTCWHCKGTAQCGCISCAERLCAEGSSPCVVCKGTGKAWTWVH